MDEKVDDRRPSRVGLAEVGEHGYENGQMMVPEVERWLFICNWFYFAHQCRKISFCFLRTMKTVSPSSRIFERVNIQVQKAIASITIRYYGDHLYQRLWWFRSDSETEIFSGTCADYIIRKGSILVTEPDLIWRTFLLWRLISDNYKLSSLWDVYVSK